MKKIFLLLSVTLLLIACNNEAGSDDAKDSQQKHNNAVADSMPATRSGDTSSYERMPNRISDSAGQ